MTRTYHHKFWVLAAAVLGAMSLPLIAYLAFCTLFMQGELVYVAEYADKSFSWGRGYEVADMRTGGQDHDYRIADVYLKLRSGSIIRLWDISEEMARDWVWTQDEMLRREQIGPYIGFDGIEVNRYAIDGALGNEFYFRDGRLVEASISGNVPDQSPLAGVEIAPGPNGEFLSFPIAKDDVFRVFGKPNRVRKFRMRHH